MYIEGYVTAWDSDEAYQKGMVVHHDDKFWYQTEDVAAGEPGTENSGWHQVFSFNRYIF